MQFAGRISWEEAVEREQAWQDRLAAANHPAYGLGPHWTGPRMVGDVHFVGDAIESVGLAHGDPTEGEAPLIHVHTTRIAAERIDDTAARRSGLFPRATAAVAVPAFAPVGHEFVVAGQPRAAEGVAAADGWLIRVAAQPGVTVHVEGHRIELARFAREHTLVEVNDLAPYFEGRLSMLRNARG